MEIGSWSFTRHVWCLEAVLRMIGTSILPEEYVLIQFWFLRLTAWVTAAVATAWVTAAVATAWVAAVAAARSLIDADILPGATEHYGPPSGRR